MATFAEYEEIGRSKLVNFLSSRGYSDVSFSTNRFSPYDATIRTSDGEVWLVEIKVRAEKYSTYPDMLLEEKKLIALKREQENLGATRIFYFNFFIDSPIVKIASLENLPVLTFEGMGLPKTTAAGRGFISKAVTLIKNFKIFNL